MTRKATGRPNGRPPGAVSQATREGKNLARLYGPAAIERIAHLAGLVTREVEVEGHIVVQPIGMATKHSDQLTALQCILDRGYGKATQPISGDDEMPEVQAALRVVYVEPKKPKKDAKA